MQRSFVLLTVATFGLAVLVLPNASIPDDAHDAFFAAERRALQAHFDTVDTELHSASESHLSLDQRFRRHELTDWLRAYRTAGEFPRNVVASGHRVPIFRDERGVLCAMAYLIERSGRMDIVDRIAASQNLAYIPQLAGDSALVAWLDANGLSVSEAARIQPAYEPGPGSPKAKIETKFLWVSVALIAVDATATYLSATRPSQRSVAAGLIGGVGALAVGSSHLKDEGNSRSLARATTAVGAVTTAVAFWRAITPDSWYEVGPLRHAATMLGSVRVSSLALPTGAVAPAVGWSASFR